MSFNKPLKVCHPEPYADSQLLSPSPSIGSNDRFSTALMERPVHPANSYSMIDTSELRLTSREFTRHEFCAKIAEIICQNRIPFFFDSGIGQEEAWEDFQRLKNEINTGTSFLIDPSITPCYQAKDADYPPGNNLTNIFFDAVIRRTPSLGKKASNYCQYSARVHSHSHAFSSPVETWNSFNAHSIAGLIRWLPNILSHDPDTPLSERHISLAIAKSANIAAQFPVHALPAVLRCLRDFAKTPAGEKWSVLDFSSGWSDRLIGAKASEEMVSHYVGVDPNPALAEGQAKACLYPSSVHVRHIQKCFEKTVPEDFEGLSFDIAMTSPPFFVKDTFNDNEDIASSSEYAIGASMEEKLFHWREGFLFPAIKKAWERLKKGGFLAIHIDDVSFDSKNFLPICDPMNNYIGRILKGEYLGAMGLALNSEPNQFQTIPAEPIWIWKKV